MELLKVENLKVHYGAIYAIKDISFHVNKGEIVTLIGANGAGKTSTLHAVSRLIPISGGQVTYNNTNLATVKPYQITGLGMAQVPEGRRIFAGMSVKENLQIGAYSRNNKAHVEEDYEKVLELLPRLSERRAQLAGTLSGGEQQMLAMGRALMSKPDMLLLDEPSMGLSPLLVKEIFKLIEDVKDSGVTILLVEQNAKMALEIANRAYVLETGKIVMEGDAKELANRKEIKEAYLGG